MEGRTKTRNEGVCRSVGPRVSLSCVYLPVLQRDSALFSFFIFDNVLLLLFSTADYGPIEDGGIGIGGMRWVLVKVLNS